MEEKKPLESRNLTHTSKEPEAQVWAKIGTASYVTPTKPALANSTAEEATVVPDNSSESKAVEASDQSESKEEEVCDQTSVSDQLEAAEAKEEEVSSLELHVDSNAEPIQRESAEADPSTSTKAETLEERRKRNRLGDGFEGDGEEETEKKEEEPERTRSKARSSRDRSKSHERSRDRSRSTSRGREGRDSRGRPIRESTNSTDTRKIRSRVFVGHLTTQECNSDALREAFSKYGKITGINLQNGYGFVQFDTQEAALESIKGMNQTKLFGETIGKIFFSSAVAM